MPFYIISIKDNKLNVVVGKKLKDCDAEKVQNYLVNKLSREMIITKSLPKNIDKKNFKHTMRNGILEIMFSKN